MIEINVKENKYSWFGDYIRSTNDNTLIWRHFIKDFIFQHRLRYMIYFRIAQKTKKKLVKLYCEIKLFCLNRKYGIELKTSTIVGRGFVMTHPYNITISPLAIIGDNVTILKGATLGFSGGKKSGAPTIGNQVYIGINSTILGGVSIGDDVIVAPNAFVNVDVPNHSIVIGNPCIIIPREGATKGYIWKIVV